MTEFKYIKTDTWSADIEGVIPAKIMVQLEIAYQLKRIADNTEGLKK